LSRLTKVDRLTTVLVATSGDTGAAVASAFHRRPGFRVVILYPDGRVSPRQAHQLGAFGGNVTTFRVAGTFDDCQRVVKAAFGDHELTARHALVSANSISLGRLLPQMAYYAHASLSAHEQEKGSVSFVVPTGNLGNAFACLLAKECGLPIDRVVLATNANRVLADFVATGHYEPRASLATLANAMDVGAPSNVERLRHRFEDVTKVVQADWVDDETIRSSIKRTLEETGQIICPHTACGMEVLRRLRSRGAKGTWLVAATAHPAKFDSVVEPLIGRTVPVPPALAELLARPSFAAPLEPTLSALAARLGSP
jgi:threonine synthase